MPPKPLLVIISGPTAVGKTDTTIKLAQIFETEIISADSRQFYKEMKIGTARPTEIELAAAPHHFVGFLSIHESYTVADFERDAIALLSKLFLKHNVVLVSGGSGLFIRAITDGLDDIPSVDEAIRANLMKELESNGLDSLANELQQKDPAYANEVDLKNPQRVIRALEVIRQTGRAFSEMRKGTKKEREFEVLKIILNRNREELYQRINKRVDLMLETGLEAEAKALYPYRHLNALQTVGYSELFEHFDGKISRDEAIELIKQNTRRYAKRQLTWFRKESNSHWFEPDEIKKIEQLIREKLKKE